MVRAAIVAHEFSPFQGSECAEGWRVSRALSQSKSDVDLTVFSASGPQFFQGKYTLDFKNFNEQNNNAPNLTVIFVDYPAWTSPLLLINRKLFGWMSGVGLPILYGVCYRAWLQECKKIVTMHHDLKKFDVIHLLTQITVREPGAFWELRDCKFIWGPTGGSESLPLSFRRSMGILPRAVEEIRALYFNARLQSKTVLSAIRNSDFIFAFSKTDLENFSRIRGGSKNNMQLMVDSACEVPDPDCSIRQLSPGEPLRLIWVGQLNKRKNLSVLLNAIAGSEILTELVSVTVIGDGPDKLRLITLCSSKGLKNVQFLGNVPHHTVKNSLDSSHILVHTSYREAGTHIVPEALSRGLPVVCHQIGGLELTISDKNGWPIPLVSNEFSTAKIRSLLEEVVAQPENLSRKSAEAIKFAESSSWEHMAARILDVYISGK